MAAQWAARDPGNDGATRGPSERAACINADRIAEATRIVEAARIGDYPRTRSVVLTATPADLREATPAVRTLYRALGASPHGATSADGVWLGESADHYDCATLALMAGVGAARAARMTAVAAPVADDLAALFPEDLDLFVRTWSEQYQRSPKNWDRVAHYPVMFTWVRAGLVLPPSDDGAVNLLLRELSVSPKRYRPELDPGLFSVTVPGLFTAEVRPSLGAAAIDSQLPPGDQGRIDELVLQLVTEGVWDPDDTARRTQAALATRESAFQRRWLQSLQARLPGT